MELEFFEGADESFKNKFSETFKDAQNAQAIIDFLEEDRKAFSQAQAKNFQTKFDADLAAKIKEKDDAFEAWKTDALKAARDKKAAEKEEALKFLNEGENKVLIKRFFNGVEDDKLVESIDAAGVGGNLKVLQTLAELGKKFNFENGTGGNAAGGLNRQDPYAKSIENAAAALQKANA